MNTVLKDKRLNWQDYLSFPSDERWEMIDGSPFAMAPAPSVPHQRLIRDLTCKLSDFLGKSGKCELFVSPCDVKLSETDIVQPDLFVVCDKNKIKATHIDGAPDLVVEVISPNSISFDRFKKMLLYAKFGVREYWIVTPEPALVEVFSLEGETFRVHGVFDYNSVLTSVRFKTLKLNLDFFAKAKLHS